MAIGFMAVSNQTENLFTDTGLTQPTLLARFPNLANDAISSIS